MGIAVAGTPVEATCGSAGGLHFDDPRGSRWDLALELLAEGREAIALPNVVLRASSDVLTIAIETRHDPRAVTVEQAAAEISAGQGLIERLRQRDARFEEVVRKRAVRWEYVYDYDTGSVLLADVDHDGEASWAEGWDPQQ